MSNGEQLSKSPIQPNSKDSCSQLGSNIVESQEKTEAVAAFGVKQRTETNGRSAIL